MIAYTILTRLPAVKFDKAIEVITKNKRTMGISEMVLERAKKEGHEKGHLKDREESLEEGLEPKTSKL